MPETGGAPIEDLSLFQKETQSFKNSYEFDPHTSSIMENIFPEVEAYNGGELSSNLFSLEVNQTPDTKKWTLKINPAKKGTSSSEPSLIELDFSGQEGTQLKTNSNPEALLALQDLKTELDEVEDSFGALRTLVGRKAQDLIESKMTPEEHAELLKLKEARAQAIQHQEEVLKANALGGPTEASPELTAALEGHDRLKEQPQELDEAETTSPESDKPSIKTAAEREKYLSEMTKEQATKDLQEIRQAIVELTHDLKAKGMGETFIQTIANRLTGLGPDSEKTLALIKNGIPDLTSDEAIKAGLQVTTPEGIKANPKLAAGLVDYQQKLRVLAENLPKNTLDEYFPGFFDHIYPDGLPEPKTTTANPNFIPSLGGDSAMEAGMEDEEYGEESNESTIDDNSEQLPITETPKSNFARWIDDPERKISSSEFAEKYQEKIAQTEAIVLEIQAEFKESHPDEYEKIFGETDSNPYDILQERIREQGKYSRGENREDVLAKFISEKLTGQNISSPEFLMTSEYLSRQHEYTKLVEAAKSAESGNEQAFKRRVKRIQKKYGHDDARRAVSSAVQGGDFGNPLSLSKLSKEMSMTAEETRLNGYQDLRALQIVKDRVLDTWDPEARARWAKYEADGSIVTLEAESKQLDKVLTNILTKESDKLTSKDKEILGVIDTLQKESVDEALSKFTGLTPLDGETTLKSIARWREEKGVEPYTQGELKQLTLKGLNLRERRSSPRTTQEITPVPPQPEFDLYFQVFQEQPDLKVEPDPKPEPGPEPDYEPTVTEPDYEPTVTEPDYEPTVTEPDPEPVEPLSEFQATVTAAKGQLGTEVEVVDRRGRETTKKLTVRELIDVKKSEFARKMMSETRRKWDPESLKNRPWYERWGQRAATLSERVWRGMLTENLHSVKEQRHAINLMAAAGIESDFDFYVFEQVDKQARLEIYGDDDTGVKGERNTVGKRIIGTFKDLGSELVGRERDLHRKRVEIVSRYRQELEQNPLDLNNPLHPLVMRNYQRNTELASRIGEIAYDETLHTAEGEKRTESTILLEKNTASRKFINQEILKPIIEGALTSGNPRIDAGLRLALDTKLNDYWLSEEFQDWRKTLPQADQEKIDLSLSYASNIISVAEEVLVPNVLAAREHYEKMEEFDFDIKLTLGTARFGPKGEIPKQGWGEKRITLNEELFKKLGKEKRLAFGDELIGQGVRHAKFLALANDLVQTELWAVPAWMGVKALTSTARLGAQAMSTPAGAAAHVFAPMLAASGVAGVMAGIKHYGSLSTDRAELNITEALGETRPKDALRAAEMKITDYHRVAFSDRIPKLQALLEKETLDKGEIYYLLALTVDSDARSDIGARRNINLWRHEITDNVNSSFQAEEGTLDVLRSQAKLKLHTALLSEATGAVITSELGFPVEASSQDIISELTRVQTEYLERGSTIPAEYLAMLQAISPAEYKAVVAQDQAFRKFQMGQAVKQGAIVFGTSFVVQVGVRAASQFVKGEHFMGGAKVAPTAEADANNQNASPAEKHGGYDPKQTNETILDSSHSPELDRSLPDGIGQVIDPETGKVIVTMNAYVPPGTNLVPQPGMPNTYDLISEKGGNTLIDNLQINPDGTPIINAHIQQQMVANGLSIRTIDLPPVEISQGGNGGYVDVRAGDLGPEGWWGMIRNKMYELNGHYPSDAETNAVKNMVRGYELWVNNPEDAGKDIFEIRPEPKYANVFQQQIIHSKPSIWGSEPAIAAQSENMWFNHIPKVLVEAENQEKLAALVREAIEQKEVQGLELDELHSLAYRIGRIAGEKMGIPNKDEVLKLLDYMQGDTTTKFNPHDILINLKEDLVVDPLPPLPPPLPPTPPHIPTDGVDIPFFFGYRRPLEAPERRNDLPPPPPPFPPAPYPEYPASSEYPTESVIEDPTTTTIPIPPHFYDNNVGKLPENAPEYLEYERNLYKTLVNDQGVYPEYEADADTAYDERLQPLYEKLHITPPTGMPYEQQIVFLYQETKNQQEQKLNTERRLENQTSYLEDLKTRSLSSNNPTILRNLHRLNGSTKGYFDELQEINSGLPPMHPDCQLTTIIPAFQEQANIENTVKSWVEQLDGNSDQPLDPNLFELVILVNRPNSSIDFDNTRQIIEKLKNDSKYTKYHINVIEKTFNFQDEDHQIDLNGVNVSIPKGRRMGLIYGLATDLAVLRNIDREASDAVKANHLIKPGGADVFARNPYYINNTLNIFENEPDIEQFNSRADYPKEIYQHIPLFHLTERFREMMNLQYTDRKSNLGLGIFKTSLYAEAGGYKATDEIAEEVRLNERMRKVLLTRAAKTGKRRNQVLKRNAVIQAIDNPRRALGAVIQGIPMLHEYNKFWNNKVVKDMTVDQVLNSPVPEQAQLTPENLTKQLEPYIQYYTKLLYRSNQNPKTHNNMSESIKEAQKFVERTLSFIGFKKEDYKLSFNNEIEQKVQIEDNLESVIKNIKFRINDLSNVLPLIEEFKSSPTKEWIAIKSQDNISKTVPLTAEESPTEQGEELSVQESVNHQVSNPTPVPTPSSIPTPPISTEPQADEEAPTEQPIKIETKPEPNIELDSNQENPKIEVEPVTPTETQVADAKIQEPVNQPVSSPTPTPTPPVNNEPEVKEEVSQELPTPIEAKTEAEPTVPNDSNIELDPIEINEEKPEINNIDSRESRLFMSRGKTEIHEFTNQEKIYHQNDEILLNGKKYLVDAASRVGEKRKVDEDFAMTNSGVWKSLSGANSLNWQVSFIFDGAGGLGGGDLASKLAAETFNKVLSGIELSELGEPGRFFFNDVEMWSEDDIPSLLQEETQKELISLKRQLENEGNYELKPTTTMAGVLTIGDKHYVIHIGDSRVYKRTADGKLIQITTDHSLVQELMNMGKQTPSEAKKNKLRSTLSRALSAEPRGEITLNEVKLGEGEGFVVMCDGIPDAYDEEYLEKGETPKKMARAISVAIAAKENAALSLLTRNTERASDNMSALVIYPKI